MTTARPAATVMVLRDGAAGIEVLMGRRPAKQAFGGAWVFPGGSVDAEDRDGSLTGISGSDAEWRAAALREVAEEVGIFITDLEVFSTEPLVGHAIYQHVRAAGANWLPDRLAYLSNWVTPEGLPKRFDTRFYLVTVEPDTALGPISSELEVVEWLRPQDALDQHERRDIELIMPTIAHLTMLLPFGSTREAEEHARSQKRVEPVEPRIVMRDGRAHIEIR